MSPNAVFEYAGDRDTLEDEDITIREQAGVTKKYVSKS